MEKAQTTDALHLNQRFNFDTPTHILFTDENSENRIESIVDGLNDFQAEVFGLYDPEIMTSIKRMQAIDLDESYTIEGEKVDWKTYHFYRIPLIGVLSELSNIQVSVRNMELQTLLYLLSQSEVSEPPIGDQDAYEANPS